MVFSFSEKHSQKPKCLSTSGNGGYIKNPNEEITQTPEWIPVESKPGSIRQKQYPSYFMHDRVSKHPRRSSSTDVTSNWVETQLRLEQSFQGIDEKIRDLVGEVRSSKRSFTEGYELKVAEQLIELLGYIENALRRHSPLAEASENSDYLEAVEQYRIFSDSIIGYLEDFGISCYCSDIGAAFDGSIHEPDRDYGASCDYRTLIVSSTVRCGFESSHLKKVIRKEKVTLVQRTVY